MPHPIHLGICAAIEAHGWAVGRRVPAGAGDRRASRRGAPARRRRRISCRGRRPRPGARRAQRHSRRSHPVARRARALRGRSAALAGAGGIARRAQPDVVPRPRFVRGPLRAVSARRVLSPTSRQVPRRRRSRHFVRALSERGLVGRRRRRAAPALARRARATSCRTGGTLVCFLAEHFEHEVLPSTRERLAVERLVPPPGVTVAREIDAHARMLESIRSIEALSASMADLPPHFRCPCLGDDVRRDRPAGTIGDRDAPIGARDVAGRARALAPRGALSLLRDRVARPDDARRQGDRSAARRHRRQGAVHQGARAGDE